MKDEPDRLLAVFFQSVSFEQGARPAYEQLYSLFIEDGLLIRNSLSAPEISTVREFIESRAALAASGRLTFFEEAELSGVTEQFGNVAQRFSAYRKSGLQDGAHFSTRGMISTQFIRTLAGWKISAMAWDDERPGLTLPGAD